MIWIMICPRRATLTVFLRDAWSALHARSRPRTPTHRSQNSCRSRIFKNSPLEGNASIYTGNSLLIVLPPAGDDSAPPPTWTPFSIWGRRSRVPFAVHTWYSHSLHPCFRLTIRFRLLAEYYAVLFLFSIRFWLFSQVWTFYVHQSYGFCLALFGVSPRTLREVSYAAPKPASPSAQLELLPTSHNPTKKIWNSSWVQK